MRQSLGETGMRMASVRVGKLRGLICADLNQAFIQDLLKDPDSLFQKPGAGILKQSGNTRTLRLSAEGKEWFLKHYRFRGWLHSFMGLFRGSRGRKAMAMARMAAGHGIPTPQPVCFLERERFFIPVESFILYEFHAELETLTQVYHRLGQELFLKTGLLGQIGHDLAEMHAQGLYHGDFKWSNILVSEASKGIQLLVDLDGAGRMGLMKDGKMAMDLGRFLVDLLEMMQSRSPGMEEFLHAYLDAGDAIHPGSYRLLSPVEKQVIRKLKEHAKARGHTITLKRGELLGLMGYRG